MFYAQKYNIIALFIYKLISRNIFRNLLWFSQSVLCFRNVGIFIYQKEFAGELFIYIKLFINRDGGYFKVAALVSALLKN